MKRFIKSTPNKIIRNVSAYISGTIRETETLHPIGEFRYSTTGMRFSACVAWPELAFGMRPDQAQRVGLK